MANKVHCETVVRTPLGRSSMAVLAGVLLVASLSGCDQKKQNDSASQTASTAPLPMPLTTGPVTSVAPAPAAAALPPAAPARVVRVSNPTDEYAYVDRASAMSDAIGQAPPDYGFDYQGTRPWVWRSANQSVTLVEPVDGGYRYYYYQPGATQPYLVRDPQYSYGYSDGQLVAVYTNDGQLLPPPQIDQRADYAGRYLARAVALYEASLQSERHSVNAANWAARRAEIDAARSQWEAQQAQQAAWRAYHAEHQAEEQAYWQGERAQRERAAQSFDVWSHQGYAGPPPATVYAQNRQDGGQGAPPVSGSHQPLAQASYPAQPNQQQNAIDQARKQQAQADAAREAQAKAQQESLAQARQQQSQADAAHQAQAAAQARAQEGAVARARQQQAQQDAAQQAERQTAEQAIAKAKQQQAQIDAAKRSQVQTDEAAAALAQKQKAQAAIVAQQQARTLQAAQARQAQQDQQAAAARQAQARAAAADAQVRQAKAQSALDAAKSQPAGSPRDQRIAQPSKPPVQPQAVKDRPAASVKASKDKTPNSDKEDGKHRPRDLSGQAPPPQ